MPVGGTLECGGRVDLKIGSRTVFWYNFFMIATAVGIYGLILGNFYMTSRPTCDQITAEVTKAVGRIVFFMPYPKSHIPIV